MMVKMGSCKGKQNLIILPVTSQKPKTKTTKKRNFHNNKIFGWGGRMNGATKDSTTKMYKRFEEVSTQTKEKKSFTSRF